MKDSEIVDLYWDRNEDAIHQTQLKYEAYLSKVAYNILADFEDSKECVNDTYLAAWNSIPPHKPNVLSTYLGKITRQLSIDVFRKKNATKRYASEYALSLEELGDSFSDGSTLEQAVDAKLLDKANDPLCVGMCLRDLIQCIFDEIMIFHFTLPLSGVVLHVQKLVCNKQRKAR